MSVQDNYLKTTDGYFARLSPLLDSVEEVTVTTAGNTADATGQGAVQIRFVTKAGTNQWNGTGLRISPSRCAERQHAGSAIATCRRIRRPARRRRTELRQYTHGLRAGRPDQAEQGVLLLQLRGAAAPELEHAAAHHPDAGGGVGHLQLQRAGGVQQQNLLQIAAANGQLATIDPTVAKILGRSRRRRRQSGGVTPLNNPLVQQYTWSMPTQSFNPSPTMRLDYEVTQQPSPDRVVQLSPHQLDAGHDQQRATALPEFAARPAASSRRAGRRRSRCVRRLATTCSTSSASAARAARRCSRRSSDRTCGRTPTAIA